MTPLINLLTLEKKLLDYIKFIEPIIFEDDHLSNEELKFYTKKYNDARHKLHKCREEIRKYFTKIYCETY